MAKRQSKKQAESTSKDRLEFRVRDNLAERFRKMADDAGISLNQLGEGIIRWVIKNGHVGQPFNDQGIVDTDEKESGVVWFGFDGYTPDGHPVGHGDVVFVLDFSGRHAVIDGDKYRPGQED